MRDSGAVRLPFVPRGDGACRSVAARCVTARCVLIGCLVLGGGARVEPAVSGAEPSGLEPLGFAQQRQAAMESFNVGLQACLASWDAAQKAEAIRTHWLFLDPSREYYFVPPESTGNADGSAALATSDLADLPRELRDLYLQQADTLFRLAQRAVEAGEGAVAYQLLHDVLYFSPQHRDARQWLGLPLAGRSRLKAPDTSLRPSRRPHARFGWPANTHFQLATPHFLITTNDQAETARRLANELERLRAVWEQMFFDCWGTAEQLRSAAARTRRLRAPTTRRRVVLFRNRAEYLKYIRQLEPRAELTRGYYHAPTKTAFFVGGPDPVVTTWRHEATHQLFAELPGSVHSIGERHNFWIIEGIALYFESLHGCQRWTCVGGIEAERLQFARFRALREGTYLPLQELTRLNKNQFQTDPQIRSLYSQSAGLTHYFMHDRQRDLRPALRQYLAAVYRDQDSLNSLKELAGSSLAELDQGYQDFLRLNDDDLRRLDPDVSLRNLSLGGTRVTDAGLLSLPKLKSIEWLDLFGTQVSDAGTEGLAAAVNLRQLSLERTQISDKTVGRLGDARRLQQLDLSGTGVTDAGLAVVGQLTSLEALWLANTLVTDRGIAQLRDLAQLRTLDLTGTHVTAAAQRQLADALPLLQTENPALERDVTERDETP